MLQSEGKHSCPQPFLSQMPNFQISVSASVSLEKVPIFEKDSHFGSIDLCSLEGGTAEFWGHINTENT